MLRPITQQTTPATILYHPVKLMQRSLPFIAATLYLCKNERLSLGASVAVPLAAWYFSERGQKPLGQTNAERLTLYKRWLENCERVKAKILLSMSYSGIQHIVGSELVQNMPSSKEILENSKKSKTSSTPLDQDSIFTNTRQKQEVFESQEEELKARFNKGRRKHTEEQRARLEEASYSGIKHLLRDDSTFYSFVEPLDSKNYTDNRLENLEKKLEQKETDEEMLGSNDSFLCESSSEESEEMSIETPLWTLE